nr:RecName: Full=Unknown protein 8 [Pseudotsuga menziesii]
LQQAEARR